MEAHAEVVQDLLVCAQHGRAANGVQVPYRGARRETNVGHLKPSAERKPTCAGPRAGWSCGDRGWRVWVSAGDPIFSVASTSPRSGYWQ